MSDVEHLSDHELIQLASRAQAIARPVVPVINEAAVIAAVLPVLIEQERACVAERRRS